MRHTLLFLVLLLALNSQLFAQNASIRGFVTEQATGQSLELVNILLEDSNGEVVGTVTSPDGVFQFRRLAQGQYRIQASFIGYQVFRDTLQLEWGQVLTYNIALEEDTGELGELVVEAQAEASVAAPIAGLQTIRPADIERVPTPDVSGDLVSYLTTLPGIVSTGDQGGQLFIRGGEPSQNMVLLDGMVVYQPFHILGFYSAFPSDIVNKADVYAGGFGGKFGGRLSSVIDVRTREGNAFAFSGSASVSPFLGAVQLEGPLIPGRMSFLASARQSLLDDLAGQYVDDPLPFEFSDLFAKINLDVTRTSKLSVSYLQTTDEGTLSKDEIVQENDLVRWENRVIGGRFLFLPPNFGGSVELRVSYSELNNEIGVASNPLRLSNIKNTHVALEANFPGQTLSASAGIDFRPITVRTILDGLYQNVNFRIARLINWGNYLEMTYRVGDHLRIQPSIRAQFYKVRFNPYLEPRIRLIWERGRHRVSAGTGIYHQELLGLNDRRDAANVFTAWTSIPSEDAPAAETDITAGRIQDAFHALLGYNFEVSSNLQFSIETYYKDLSNLFISEWTSFPRFTTILQPATGTSAGFDTRLDYQRDNFYMHLNYAYSATNYEAEQASLEIWYGEETLDFRPPHDRRHQANVLIGGTVAGFDLSARWTFGSGFPYSRAVGFDGFALIDDIVDVGRLPTSRRVIYERPFSGELPHYHRLDLSLERVFTAGSVDVTVQGSLLNAYNRANIFYLDVFTLQRVDQLPVIPSIGLKVAL
ncbi:MAG: TonB-dependent receptor [Rhodothermaceae bacterium]|nr:TonB-dependent receptor [Rhodothermaceae bacterium]